MTEYDLNENNLPSYIESQSVNHEQSNEELNGEINEDYINEELDGNYMDDSFEERELGSDSELDDLDTDVFDDENEDEELNQEYPSDSDVGQNDDKDDDYVLNQVDKLEIDITRPPFTKRRCCICNKYFEKINNINFPSSVLPIKIISFILIRKSILNRPGSRYCTEHNNQFYLL